MPKNKSGKHMMAGSNKPMKNSEMERTAGKKRVGKHRKTPSPYYN